MIDLLITLIVIPMLPAIKIAEWAGATQIFTGGKDTKEKLLGDPDKA